MSDENCWIVNDDLLRVSTRISLNKVVLEGSQSRVVHCIANLGLVNHQRVITDDAWVNRDHEGSFLCHIWEILELH